LSANGQQQAQNIGEQFKARGIEKADIYSSQWCRCVDTATNLKFGSVQSSPMLNSFYQNRATEAEQTAQLANWITKRLATRASDTTTDQQHTSPAILVTHQVNITALTGVFPSYGEVVFVALKNGQLTVLATWLSDN